MTCNAIGTSPDGAHGLGNSGAGIAVRSTDPAATAADDDLRQHHHVQRRPGVLVGAGARFVSIRGNRIDLNGGVGIDLVAAGGARERRRRHSERWTVTARAATTSSRSPA